MTDFFLADSDATELLGQVAGGDPPAAGAGRTARRPGAGKSTTARALLRAGRAGRHPQPHHTLVERYPLATGGEAWHLDLYRIGQAGELDFLGLDEGSAVLWLVEWPERGAGALPPTDLVVALEIEGTGRRVRLTGASDVGREWLTRLPSGGDLQAISVG